MGVPGDAYLFCSVPMTVLSMKSCDECNRPRNKIGPYTVVFSTSPLQMEYYEMTS